MQGYHHHLSSSLPPWEAGSLLSMIPSSTMGGKLSSQHDLPLSPWEAGSLPSMISPFSPWEAGSLPSINPPFSPWEAGSLPSMIPSFTMGGRLSSQHGTQATYPGRHVHTLVPGLHTQGGMYTLCAEAPSLLRGYPSMRRGSFSPKGDTLYAQRPLLLLRDTPPMRRGLFSS